MTNIDPDQLKEMVEEGMMSRPEMRAALGLDNPREQVYLPGEDKPVDISLEARMLQLEAREREFRAKLQKIKAQAAPLQRLPKSAGSWSVLGECAGCGDEISVFTAAPYVTDSDGRSFCDAQCMMRLDIQERLELEDGIEYVKRSLGVEE